jgi:transcriptional regulatory protein GAL4
MEASNGHRRKRSTNPHQRACIECQKRKTRCVASKETTLACSYCNKAGKHCAFDAPPARTSLTRKNLDAAELRCRQLESVLRSLHPEVDLDMAVQGVADISVTSDAEEKASDEYEWNETSPPETPNLSKSKAPIRDGMANLPTESKESGYLGKKK